jgi:hypothetical protein
MNGRKNDSFADKFMMSEDDVMEEGDVIDAVGSTRPKRQQPLTYRLSKTSGLFEGSAANISITTIVLSTFFEDLAETCEDPTRIRDDHIFLF